MNPPDRRKIANEAGAGQVKPSESNEQSAYSCADMPSPANA